MWQECGEILVDGGCAEIKSKSCCKFHLA
jgi:hypothetical protein